MKEPSLALRLPVQSPPVSRGLVGQGHVTEAGVEAAQMVTIGCHRLPPGPAREACLARAALDAAASAAAAAAAAVPSARI